MISFTGTHISRTFGSPNVRDISVQLMRIIRFGGAGDICWPVGIHSLLVADLLPPELEVYGLLHDAAESCVADVPRPMKTNAAREVEAAVTKRIYAHLGVPLPTAEEAALVHEADVQAGMAEGAHGCGPRGYEETMTNYRYNPRAVMMLRTYLDSFKVAEAMDANGCWVHHFERRLLRALRTLHSNISYTEAA